MHLIKKLRNTLKLKTKPWVTVGIQNSTKVKNDFLKNYINKKDITLKKLNKYAKYRKYI